MPKIESIVTDRVVVPIRQDWMVKGGAGAHDQSPFLIVRLRGEGLEGIGEVSGTYPWSGEGYETAEAAVKNVLTPSLLGMEFSPNQIRNVMDKALAGFHFTKAGIEMACWDALGKALGVSIQTLLGGAIRTKVLSKFSISGVPPQQAAAIAQSAMEAGFRKFKVKVGTGLAEDLERVAAVRIQIGDDASLGVDANGGWTLSEARKALRPLEEMKISAIEQPLSPDSLQEMARLRAHSNIPILLDESIWTARDVARVASIGAADAVNIYIGKAGGILGALEAVKVAQATGLDATMGSNQELGIGHAAIMQVLGVSSGFDLDTYPPDIAAPMYYTADLVEPGFEMQDGEVPIPTGHGLGVKINEAALNEFRA